MADDEKKYDKAIDLYAKSTDLTDNDLQELSEDREVMDLLRDLSALGQASVEKMTDLNIDARWNRFKFRRSKEHKKNLLVGIGSSLLVAASLLLLFMLSYRRPDVGNVKQLASKEHSTVIYQADPGQPVVSLSSNVSIPLNELTANQEQYVFDANKVTVADCNLTVNVPKGQSYRVDLADGTKVYLYADSRLTFPTSFTGSNREVLLHGEGYFVVAHDAEKPFIVIGDNFRTVVLGTEFNFKSYGQTDDNVTLIKGSVRVSSKEKSVTIIPGQQVRLTENGDLATTNVNLDRYTYWRDGFIYFDNETLETVMIELGRQYNYTIDFKNKELSDYRIHFVIERSSDINDVIKILNDINRVHVVKKEKTLIVD